MGELDIKENIFTVGNRGDMGAVLLLFVFLLRSAFPSSVCCIFRLCASAYLLGAGDAVAVRWPEFYCHQPKAMISMHSRVYSLFYAMHGIMCLQVLRSSFSLRLAVRFGQSCCLPLFVFPIPPPPTRDSHRAFLINFLHGHALT